MKLAFASTILCIVSAVTLASPTPVGDEFDLSYLVETVEESLDPYDYDELSTFIQKRDNSGLEHTIESLLNVVNDSGILWTVLDQVAYYPTRIEYIANLTAKLIGGANISSVAGLVSGLNLDLSDFNVSAIVSAVESSGVVQSLLDGILLDEDYRPTLVKLVSRILLSQKNTFLYLVQDVFKSSSKSKRAESSALETFIGNFISTILSSTLASNVAKDVLTALNETQFLTYTVKHFIADEGYQNMTAQLIIDIVNTGAVKVSGSSINVTSITSKVLGNTALISNAVGFLLSGNLNLGGLGKYADAVSAIIKDVESSGTFAELNDYVFSESHTVTTPIFYTGQVVVARTATFSYGGIAGLLNATTTTSSTKTSSTKRSSSTITSGANSSDSDFSYASTDDLNALESAAEVASLLSLLGAETTGASSVASSYSSAASSAASTAVDSLSRFLETFGQSASSSSSLRRSSLTRSSTSYSSMVTITVTSGATSSTSDDEDGLLALILAALTRSTSTNNARKREVSSQNSGAPSRSVPMVLVYIQVVLFGGILLL